MAIRRITAAQRRVLIVAGDDLAPAHVGTRRIPYRTWEGCLGSGWIELAKRPDFGSVYRLTDAGRAMLAAKSEE